MNFTATAGGLKPTEILSHVQFHRISDALLRQLIRIRPFDVPDLCNGKRSRNGGLCFSSLRTEKGVQKGYRHFWDLV